MYNAAGKFTQLVRYCANQIVQLCVHAARCSFSIGPLAKQTDAQSVTRQSSAKQTQANRLMLNRQLLKRYKPDMQC